MHYFWQKNIAEAIDDLEEAVENYQLAGVEYQSSYTLSSLSLLYIEFGEVNMATRTIKKAKKISSIKKEKFHDYRLFLIEKLIDIKRENINVVEFEKIVVEHKYDLENHSNFEYAWLTSNCYYLIGNREKADYFMKMSQQLVVNESKKISNSSNRKNFLYQHMLNRKILKGRYLIN